MLRLYLTAQFRKKHIPIFSEPQKNHFSAQNKLNHRIVSNKQFISALSEKCAYSQSAPTCPSWLLMYELPFILCWNFNVRQRGIMRHGRIYNHSRPRIATAYTTREVPNPVNQDNLYRKSNCGKKLPTMATAMPSASATNAVTLNPL